MNRDQIVDVIRRWEHAFAARDLKKFVETYAESAVLESPTAGSVAGRDAVLRATLALLSAFPDSQFRSETPMVDGNRATVPASVSGTHVGTFMGIQPTGRPFQFTLVFLLDFDEDGHIVHDRRIYDFTGFLVQLGVLKAKPA